MIENYLYSIPKWKKIFYGVLFAMLIFSLVSVRVDSGLFSWITGTITDNITDEIFTAVNQSAGEAVGSILVWLFNLLVGPFGPELTTFVSNTNFGTANAKDFLDGFAISVGMFISTLIWGFSMFTYFFSGKITDSKDTPISLTFRYAIAIAICYKQTAIVDTFIDLVDILYTAFTKNAIGTVLKGSGFLNIMGTAVDGSVALLGKTIVFAAFPGVGLIVLILEIVLIWKLLKGFIQLYCEMISRYIVSCVLLLLFSAFGGTIVSNNTSQIFKSYLRTLLASFAVMLFNILWFKMCFLAVIGGTVSLVNFVQYIFVIELLHFGLKFDGMLRSMGLGVATGGSRLASAVGGAGRNLANSLRAANDMRKAGGNLLAAKGLAAGNKDMFNMGSKMAANPMDIAKGRLNNPNNVANMAAGYGANGQKISDGLVSGKQAAGIMSNALKNPNDKDAQNAMAALSNKKLAEGAQEMLGDGFKVNSAQLQQQRGADGKMHNTVGFNAQKAGGNRSFAELMYSEHGQSFNGQIGGSGTFASGLAVGDGGLTANCADSLDKGDECSVKDAAFFAGQDAANALEGVTIGGQGLEDGSLVACGKDENGNDSFRVYDGNGDIVGSINGDQFTAAASSMEASDRAEALEGIRDDIMSKHPEFSDMSDFTPDKDNTGRYTAVAHGQDADGNDFTRTFVAKDKGMIPTSNFDPSNPDNYRYQSMDADDNIMEFDVSPSKFGFSGSNDSGTQASNASFGGGSESVNETTNTVSEESHSVESGSSSYSDSSSSGSSSSYDYSRNDSFAHDLRADYEQSNVDYDETQKVAGTSERTNDDRGAVRTKKKKGGR